MNKFTNCHKTLEALLTIDFDEVKGYDSFLKLFFQIQDLDCKEEAKFDPRKYKNVLGEFEHLLSKSDYRRIKKDFKIQIKELLKNVLGDWDVNHHTPLHVSSYKGDFKSSRLFTSLGADPQSAANAGDPLTVAKDKYTRDVLQTLTDAAQTAN